ncbi:TRAP transporter small permease [Plastorhodobacter daqingensis]|uniref:TRAP transporter small permease protein n=1 Tax=Plastorhodobacter daqingensis TaxID=1387281 RepID=A0ABW2UGC0_9RHOB
MVFLSAAALLLFLMMVMTFVDVTGRYLLNQPLGFAFEMTQIMMAAMVFCALPSVTLRDEHVTAGLFDTLFRGRLRVARDALIAGVVAFGCGFLAWRLSFLAERFMTFGDRTSALRFPVGIVAWLGVACLGAAAVAGVVLLLGVVRERNAR